MGDKVSSILTLIVGRELAPDELRIAGRNEMGEWQTDRYCELPDTGKEIAERIKALQGDQTFKSAA